MVKLLVESGADVDERWGLNQTPLIQSFTSKKFEILDYLLSKNADPLTEDYLGYDLIELIKFYGPAGTPINSPELQWYYKVEQRLKEKGYLK
jgi:ankyrin repeat protein